MDKKFPQKVEDAKKAGKQVLELEGDERTYYFVQPDKKHFERFLGTATKGKVSQAAKNLVMETAIHPTADELVVEFEEKPGRMVALCDALQQAVGLKEDFSVKKL